MSYAKRKDGQGWRAVNGPEDCQEDETWQEDQPDVLEIEGPQLPANPVEKFKDFLAANPDVAALLGFKAA